MKPFSCIAAACLPWLVAGCALPTIQMPPTRVPLTPPAAWIASLPDSVGQALAPHQGKLDEMSRWWQRQGDPLLVQLIESAQAVSPTVASAASRIEQTRANRVATGALVLPSLEAVASASKSNGMPPLPANTSSSGALQASWEIDLFNANRTNVAAAQARFEGAQAGWHDARVSVAAEVANRYYSLRACEQLLAVTRLDAASRSETARLTQLSAAAGFQAPATAALARASAADGSSRVLQQQGLCEIDIKALVALSALDEPALRRQLAGPAGVLPQSAAITVSSLPAETLAQRPDVFLAETEVAAASAEVGNAQAQRYPRLTLSGSVGATKFRSEGSATDMTTWSIGPLAVSLPLFDGGRRVANIEAAKARYAEAVVKYRDRVRQAVREVEEALVSLASSSARSQDAQQALEGYRISFLASEALYQGGMGSLFQLEEARRTRLAAEVALVTLQRERIAAWIALYRAAGGGWSAGTVALATALP